MGFEPASCDPHWKVTGVVDGSSGMILVEGSDGNRTEDLHWILTGFVANYLPLDFDWIC